MRREPDEEELERHAIVPFNFQPRLSTSKIIARELRRLIHKAQPTRLWFACARRWNRWQRWCHWVAKPRTPYQPVFVVASPRSGSNLLIDYLRQLPGVGCMSEVLNWGLPIGPNKYQHPYAVVRHLQQSLQTLGTRQRGCKLFLHELEHYRLAIEDLERAFPQARYLVLYRENLAEQFVSNRAAKQTGQWILLAGQQRKKATVAVDPTELRQYCLEMRRKYTTIAANRAIVQRGAFISYEELVTNPARCLRDVVCPLLGVPYVEPKSGLCKQNVESLRERITNYAEVAGLLNQSLSRLQISLAETPSRRTKAA